MSFRSFTKAMKAYSIERKTANPRPVYPYDWKQSTVQHILDNRQYTGCAVNGKSSIVSYKVHKSIEYDESEWQIIPNMQEPIIDEETFNIVYQMRQGRRRNTATGRSSMFSGLVFCGDRGAKMYYCASKSIKENQDFFRCSAYKENRGTCSIHFIRNVVLEELALETITSVAKYISEYEPVFLFLYAKNHKLAAAKEMRNAKLKLEQAKKRVGELDKLIKSVFEQHILGTLSEESYRTMIADYEKEQREVNSSFLNPSQKSKPQKRKQSISKCFLKRSGNALTLLNLRQRS